MTDKMKSTKPGLVKPMTDDEGPVSAEAIQEMRDKKMREQMGKAYDKAREQSLGAPEKKMAKGGSVKSSASRRADGCATKGKTKGRIV
jgi:hypothetical protein